MKLRSEGATVYQFEGGEPYMNTPDFVKEAMVRALSENKTRYAPSSGIPELRAAIADKLRTKNSIAAQPSDVIVMNGGMQGLFGAFQSVVNPGEEVLVFSPYWTPIKDLIAHCQGKPILVPTAEARAEGFEKTLPATPAIAPERFTTTHHRILPALSSLAKKRAPSRVLRKSAI
jgi:aspartate aminotransferase